jgi:hypothetical protein
MRSGADGAVGQRGACALDRARRAHGPAISGAAGADPREGTAIEGRVPQLGLVGPDSDKTEPRLGLVGPDSDEAELTLQGSPARALALMAEIRDTDWSWAVQSRNSARQG